MGRDLWDLVREGLRRLPRRRTPRGQRYSNADVLAVLLWAALHGRGVHWACRRSSWPVQAWRRRLPDQSTASRRLRRPDLAEDLERLTLWLQRRLGPAAAGPAVVDGKALAVNAFSVDADARWGWGSGQRQKGYKLHALLGPGRTLLAHAVEPMNAPEAVVAAGLVARAAAGGAAPGQGLVLADASYDTNPLHAACAAAGLTLLAPRREPHAGLARNRPHERTRVLSMTLLEGDPDAARWHRAERSAVEHYFAGLACGVGLGALPAFVRGLPRVRLWVAAKLALNAARLAAIERRKVA